MTYEPSLSGDLLQTKLYMPRLRPLLVNRPHLTNKLNTGLDRKLTLISAPAGFGKTTMVGDWIKNSDLPAAWFSLEASDNDPQYFFAYFIAALQTTTSQLGQNVQGLLETSPNLQPQEIITRLLNELSTLAEHIVFGLDDYHVLENAVIHEAMTFFLTHLPPKITLIIITRIDPPLSLAQLRVRGQLTEVREKDLRFSVAETAVFLNEVMNLNITSADITTLKARTEGWIASLHLAALSLQVIGKTPACLR